MPCDFQHKSAGRAADFRRKGQIKCLQRVARFVIVGVTEVSRVCNHNGLIAIVPKRGVVRPSGIRQRFTGAGDSNRLIRKRKPISFNRLGKALYESCRIFITHNRNEVTHLGNLDWYACRGGLNDGVAGISNRFKNHYPFDCPVIYPGVRCQGPTSSRARRGFICSGIFFQIDTDELNAPFKLKWLENLGKLQKYGYTTGIVISARRS